MNKTLKNWLPITLRNRVALWFACISLLLFLGWNFMPASYEEDMIMAAVIWPDVLSLDSYVFALRSPDLDSFRFIGIAMALILNGVITLVAIPFWRILHASKYLTLPLAAFNLAGGIMSIWYIVESVMRGEDPHEIFIISLITLSMFSLSASFFIFKNELVLRNDLNVKEAMQGEDDQGF